MTKRILKYRIDCAEEYLNEHNKMVLYEWSFLYQKYRKNELSDVQMFSLVNPDHYSELIDVESVLGSRSFSQDLEAESIDCQSYKLWGYDCGIQERSHVTMNADHLFPYSMGGPTLGSNKIYLCSVHNKIKGNDIHLYPWESDTPEWLEEIISSIHHFLI